MPKDSRVISLRNEPQETPEPPVRPPLPPPEPRRPRRSNTLSSSLIYIVILAALCGGAYAWWSWSEWFPDEPGDAQATSREEEEDEITDLVARVGELIVLPEDEEPTIATVTDPEKLRDQVFFANAKEGDVVLIYTGAQKAYLYDPKIHKLVEVAPLTIQ